MHSKAPLIVSWHKPYDGWLLFYRYFLFSGTQRLSTGQTGGQSQRPSGGDTAAAPAPLDTRKRVLHFASQSFGSVGASGRWGRAVLPSELPLGCGHPRKTSRTPFSWALGGSFQPRRCSERDALAFGVFEERAGDARGSLLWLRIPGDPAAGHRAGRPPAPRARP